VIVPAAASVLSALGAATMGMRRERVRSVLGSVAAEPAALAAIGQELAAQVASDLAADGVAPADRTVALEADLRFVRQNWELTIPLAGLAFDEGFAPALRQRFEDEYARNYGAGSISLGTPVEIVAIRAVGTGPADKGGLEAPAGKAGGPSEELAAGRRRVVRSGPQADERIDVGIFADAAIEVDRSVRGPALIERRDTSIWVPEGVLARRDATGCIVLEIS
jgi:N-methylhydantoinase A